MVSHPEMDQVDNPLNHLIHQLLTSLSALTHLSPPLLYPPVLSRLSLLGRQTNHPHLLLHLINRQVRLRTTQLLFLDADSSVLNLIHLLLWLYQLVHRDTFRRMEMEMGSLDRLINPTPTLAIISLTQTTPRLIDPSLHPADLFLPARTILPPPITTYLNDRSVTLILRSMAIKQISQERKTKAKLPIRLHSQTHPRLQSRSNCRPNDNERRRLQSCVQERLLNKLSSKMQMQRKLRIIRRWGLELESERVQTRLDRD